MNAEARDARGLRLVGASAGTGKTHRLTRDVTQAFSQNALPPEGLIAVTFTTKAAAELESRLRQASLERGALAQAEALTLAYLGTTHAVCLRLLREFAFEAGLSPVLDVIPAGEERRLLQATLEYELPRDLRARLERLAASLQLRMDSRTSRFDFVTPIEDIMTLARSNRIPPDALPDMAQRSLAALRALLPPALTNAASLEAELASALRQAISEIEALADGQKNTGEALKELRSASRTLRAQRLPWSTWNKLAKLKPGKQAVPLVARVREAAAAVEKHPRFQSELAELTLCIFEAARVGLRAYGDWKSERGLVDYVDMIDHAFDLLALPEVSAELSERLELVVVDELQDTSPVQLALFMRLHALARSSVWVGDRKQCIFEFAGADPELMEAVSRWLPANGGDRDLLSENYRSRPQLVALCSAVFAAALFRHGCAPEEVISTAHRRDLAEQAALPPLELWWLEGKESEAIAAGIAERLRQPAATPVVDRSTNAVRPLCATDIAVLVSTNAEAERLAEALAGHGIRSALPRTGLLRTPEGTLAVAALRVLVDRWDSAALATLEALTGFGGRSHEEWLTERIQARAAALQAKASESPAGTPHELASPIASGDDSDELAASWPALEALRRELPRLCPSEALDRVLSLLDVAAWAERWPDPAQRSSNLEALRALAAAYEERCSYQREAATLGGLIRYFEDSQEKRWQRDEERAVDEQHVGAGDAVVITTYHRAKGLEWPLVILGSLGREPQRDAFDVSPESDRDTFDAADPLGGRWVRYWPWPFGLQSDAPLARRAAESPTGVQIAERESRERVRLMYVGWTRARDQLVLAVRRHRERAFTAWLDDLADADGPLLTLPEPGTASPMVNVRGLANEMHSVAIGMRLLQCPQASDEPGAAPSSSAEQRLWFKRSPEPATPRTAYRITPSDADTALPSPGNARAGRIYRLERRMEFTAPRGTTWDAIGTALHAFLAADVEGLPENERTKLAQRILKGAALEAAFRPDALVAASDALRQFVTQHWPRAVWHHEIPIRVPIDTASGRRCIHGTIDLLIESPAGLVVIDHKSFPGRSTDWAERALSYAPQLFTYAHALELIGKKVLGCFVHFTIGGGMVEIRRGIQGGVADVANDVGAMVMGNGEGQ